MTHSDPEIPPDGGDRPELAKLLSDQFAVLDDVRPVGARAVIDGDVLVFAFTWPLSRADELLLGARYKDQVLGFRTELLKLIAPSLAELVEIDIGREVCCSRPSVAEALRHAAVVFELGTATSNDDERIEALRNWSGQVRRQAGRGGVAQKPTTLIRSATSVIRSIRLTAGW
jgi:hypothetical protein